MKCWIIEDVSCSTSRKRLTFKLTEAQLLQLLTDPFHRPVEWLEPLAQEVIELRAANLANNHADTKALREANVELALDCRALREQLAKSEANRSALVEALVRKGV